MLGKELEEVSCFADGHLCISNNILIPVFSGKEVVSSRKNLFCEHITNNTVALKLLSVVLLKLVS